jgi:UDP-3-O-[3-hydroxymyristoyl] glucosamine N-acyltransferase
MPTLADIASLVGAPLADASRGRAPIRGVATLLDAADDHISFVDSDAYLKDLGVTRAAAVLVRRRVKLPADVRPVALVVDDADLALCKLLDLFAPPAQPLPAGVDPAARVGPGVTLGAGVAIAPFAVIGARARVGDRCAIHGGAHVGEDVVIGDDCVIWPNAVVRERVTIGHRVIIHANAVIGADGFGYRWDGERHAKVPHIGTVVIEDDVEIGACACVDRAKIGVTRVGRGTKIDNLVQVAHNCAIGPHCILAGLAGLAGSVTLGENVVLGGGCAVADHLTVGAGTMAAGRSAIATDIEPNARISGMPALPHRQTLREQAGLRRLPEMVAQMRKLEGEIEVLKRQLLDRAAR